METRAAKIMKMTKKSLDVKDRKLLQNLDIPYYESTKGTTPSERDIAIREYYLLSPKPVCWVKPWNSKTKEINQDMCIAPNYSRARVNLNRIFTEYTLCEDILSPSNPLRTVSSPTSNELVLDAISDIPESYSDSGSEYVPSIISSISEEMESNDEKTNLNSNDDIDIKIDKENQPATKETSKVDEPIKRKTLERPLNVKIKAAEKLDGKRVRDKGHSCYFCHKLVVNNLARHFEVNHKNEMEVARILSYAKGSKERRDSFLKLSRCGDFYHNCNTLAIRSGELILARRPTKTEIKYLNYTDFGPCPECLGFMVKKHIWHHLKWSCIVKKKQNQNEEETTENKKRPLMESTALLNGILGRNVTSEFITNIINKFINDEIAQVCKEDETIMKFGAFLFEKYDVTQSELIRQSMRQLGRLTLELKKLDKNFVNLREYLVPKTFDTIVTATKQLCVATKEITKRPEFEIPSLALKIGYALRKCIAIERGQALRAGDLQRDKNLSSFLTLLDLEWSVRISSNALQTLYTRKKTATDLLPITSDLVKLSNYLDTEMNKIKSNISNINSTKWIKLASLTLTRIILFNKRRSGEAAKMTMVDYASRPVWDSSGTQEMKDSLTPFENKLASKLTIVRITGKRGRIVPVILTIEMKESLDLLIVNRVKCGIANENPYIFALTSSSSSRMRGHDCLKKWCIEAELQSPDLITSTKLRKYVATVCQIFNLSENEHDWLARHLGHDIRVHREFYRLQENAVELTKVSRLLLAVDQGEAHKYSGKELKEINIEDLPNIEDNEDDNYINDDDNNVNDDDEEVDKNKEDEEMGIDDLIPTESSRKNLKKNVKAKGKQVNKQKGDGKRDYSGRKPWSSQEIEIILKEFKTLIKGKSLPGKDKCCAVIANNSTIFKQRKWTDLKYYVKNHLSKMNKLTTRL